MPKYKDIRGGGRTRRDISGIGETTGHEGDERAAEKGLRGYRAVAGDEVNGRAADEQKTYEVGFGVWVEESVSSGGARV